MHNDQDDAAKASNALAEQEKIWQSLESIQDVEMWVDSLDRELQGAVTKAHSTTHGICFVLAAGGEIYLQTNGEGDILLDVTPEAAWATPLLCAATGLPDSGTDYWAVPGDRLVQLIFGLNSLIAASRIVLTHRFRRPQRRY